MKKVPDMISSKDLSYLEDMFNWHYVIAKKAQTYMDIVSDESIKEFFENVYNTHKSICNKILKKLG